MSELDDFARDLARRVGEKKKAESVRDEAMLHRSALRQRTISAFWRQFQTTLRDAIEAFNSSGHITDEDSVSVTTSVDDDGEETIQVHNAAEAIFTAIFQRNVIGGPRLLFSRDTSHRLTRRNAFSDEWFTLDVSDDGKLSIKSQGKQPVSGVEDVVKRALSFMFKG